MQAKDGAVSYVLSRHEEHNTSARSSSSLALLSGSIEIDIRVEETGIQFRFVEPLVTLHPQSRWTIPRRRAFHGGALDGDTFYTASSDSASGQSICSLLGGQTLKRSQGFHSAYDGRVEWWVTWIGAGHSVHFWDCAHNGVYKANGISHVVSISTHLFTDALPVSLCFINLHFLASFSFGSGSGTDPMRN